MFFFDEMFRHILSPTSRERDSILDSMSHEIRNLSKEARDKMNASIKQLETEIFKVYDEKMHQLNEERSKLKSYLYSQNEKLDDFYDMRRILSEFTSNKITYQEFNNKVSSLNPTHFESLINHKIFKMLIALKHIENKNEEYLISIIHASKFSSLMDKSLGFSIAEIILSPKFELQKVKNELVKCIISELANAKRKHNKVKMAEILSIGSVQNYNVVVMQKFFSKVIETSLRDDIGHLILDVNYKNQLLSEIRSHKEITEAELQDKYRRTRFHLECELFGYEHGLAHEYFKAEREIDDKIHEEINSGLLTLGISFIGIGPVINNFVGGFIANQFASHAISRSLTSIVTRLAVGKDINLLHEITSFNTNLLTGGLISPLQDKLSVQSYEFLQHLTYGATNNLLNTNKLFESILFSTINASSIQLTNLIDDNSLRNIIETAAFSSLNAAIFNAPIISLDSILYFMNNTKTENRIEEKEKKQDSFSKEVSSDLNGKITPKQLNATGANELEIDTDNFHANSNIEVEVKKGYDISSFENLLSLYPYYKKAKEVNEEKLDVSRSNAFWIGLGKGFTAIGQGVSYVYHKLFSSNQTQNEYIEKVRQDETLYRKTPVGKSVIGKGGEMTAHLVASAAPGLGVGARGLGLIAANGVTGAALGYNYIPEEKQTRTENAVKGGLLSLGASAAVHVATKPAYLVAGTSLAYNALKPKEVITYNVKQTLSVSSKDDVKTSVPTPSASVVPSVKNLTSQFDRVFVKQLEEDAFSSLVNESNIKLPDPK